MLLRYRRPSCVIRTAVIFGSVARLPDCANLAVLTLGRDKVTVGFGTDLAGGRVDQAEQGAKRRYLKRDVSAAAGPGHDERISAPAVLPPDVRNDMPGLHQSPG